LYWGKSSGTYTNRIDVGNTTTYTVTGLAASTNYYYVVVAYDARKVESSHSNEVRVTTPSTGPLPVPPPSAPVIGLIGAPLTGTAPLTVTFTNKTTGAGVVYSWNFGDGTGSTLANPTHVYAAPGNYTVTLIATNNVGSRTLALAGYVKVTAKAAAIRADIVPAYGFEEGTGSKVTAASRNSDTDAGINATWNTETSSDLATAYDGAFQRLYVNRMVIAQQAGSEKTAAPWPLRFLENGERGEYFRRMIEEIRMHDPALSVNASRSDTALYVARVAP
jgi:PKD repeat protein